MSGDHDQKDVAVFGAAGYGGQELLRLLFAHPKFRVAAVRSDTHAGRPVEEVCPQLDHCYPELVFEPRDAPLPDSCEAVFLATPHTASRPLLERLPARLRVVDLSRDFRLHDGTEGDFVYGFSEGNRAAIAAARHVANPGCFATGALLALAPLAARGLLKGDLTLVQTTGSSGSGVHPGQGTHHPERAQDQRAYKVMTHQHTAEIVQELRRLGASDFDFAMVPQSGPFARGIFSVAHLRLEESGARDGDGDVEAIYRQAYDDAFFVRMRNPLPALRHVVRTNFCDLAVHRSGGRVVVLTAIDNLGKGMAGQAIQNLNLMCGFPEQAGLALPGSNP